MDGASLCICSARGGRERREAGAWSTQPRAARSLKRDRRAVGSE